MDALIPRAAFRYSPPPDQITHVTKSYTDRYIFYNVTYSPKETLAISNLKSLITSKLLNSKLPDYFCDAELLRLLYKCKFNLSVTFETLLTEIEWRSSVLPNSYHSLASKIDSLLNTGVIYIHGRDSRFRPLLIINCSKIHSMSKFINDCCYLFCYLLEFTKRQLMLAGKIETFMLITDLSDETSRKLPKKELKMLYTVFELHFSGYLYKNFILNAPKSFGISMLFSSFMNNETSRKTEVTKTNGAEILQIYFSSSQLEEKYGGSASNSSSFWPATLPDGHFATLGEPEDHHLEAEYLSESGFHSISEKINLSLPFHRPENTNLLNSSVKLDTDVYNVNMDIAISFEDIDANNLSGHAVEIPSGLSASKSASEPAQKICCKNIKCLLS